MLHSSFPLPAPGACSPDTTLPADIAGLRPTLPTACVGAIPTTRFENIDRAIGLLEQSVTCNELASVSWDAGDLTKYLEWQDAGARALAASQALLGTPGTAMSDRERELHIEDCGWLMQRAMARYEQTSCFGDRGEADKWLRLMREAINGRSPEYVAQLERQRGLD